MSKSSELDKKVKAYIIECIDNSGHSDVELTTDKQKIQFLYDTFISEYGWNVDKFGMLPAMKEYMPGLPSCFNVDYVNNTIIDLAIKWESIPADATEAQCQKILDNWFNLVANKTLQLFRKYDVETDHLPAVFQKQSGI